MLLAVAFAPPPEPGRSQRRAWTSPEAALEKPASGTIALGFRVLPLLSNLYWLQGELLPVPGPSWALAAGVYSLGV